MGMRIIQVTIEYEFGDIVYLKTDPDAQPRIVIGYSLDPGRLVQYTVQLSNFEPSYHFGFELTSELIEVEGVFRKL